MFCFDSVLLLCCFPLCSIWNAATTANLVGLMLMSVDHFVAIKFSLKHAVIMRKRTIITAIVCSWIVSLFLGLLDRILIASNRELANISNIHRSKVDSSMPFFCLKDVLYEHKLDNGTYYFNVGQKADNLIRISIDLVIVVLVCVIMLVVYLYIAVIVIKVGREKKRRLQYASILTARQIQRIKRSQLKGMCTSLLLLLTFLALWLPMVVIKVLNEFDGTYDANNNHHQNQLIMVVVCSCTALVDIFLYFLRSKEVFTLLNELKGRSTCFKTTALPNRLSHSTATTKLTSHSVSKLSNWLHTVWVNCQTVIINKSI